MQSLQGKVIAITGASSGIGRATAKLLAARGARIVLGARRLGQLEALAAELRSEGGSVEVCGLDVRDLGQFESFIALAVERFGRLDVLVNNAGVMPLSKLESRKIDEWNQMIDVNVRGVLHGIASALPRMQKEGAGHFVNVSSLGGHKVVATGAVYCATKAAVLAISEGLRQEVGASIRVTTISPGVVESELADSISDPSAKALMQEFRRVAIGPDAIARSIAYALEQPADVDVSEIVIRPTASDF